MFELKFSTANAAFDDGRHEIARILRKIAADFESGRNDAEGSGPIVDVNGNVVGKWESNP